MQKSGTLGKMQYFNTLEKCTLENTLRKTSNLKSGPVVFRDIEWKYEIIEVISRFMEVISQFVEVLFRFLEVISQFMDVLSQFMEVICDN